MPILKDNIIYQSEQEFPKVSEREAAGGYSEFTKRLRESWFTSATQVPIAEGDKADFEYFARCEYINRAKDIVTSQEVDEALASGIEIPNEIYEVRDECCKGDWNLHDRSCRNDLIKLAYFVDAPLKGNQQDHADKKEAGRVYGYDKTREEMLDWLTAFFKAYPLQKPIDLSKMINYDLGDLYYQYYSHCQIHNIEIPPSSPLDNRENQEDRDKLMKSLEDMSDQPFTVIPFVSVEEHEALKAQLQSLQEENTRLKDEMRDHAATLQKICDNTNNVFKGGELRALVRIRGIASIALRQVSENK